MNIQFGTQYHIAPANRGGGDEFRGFQQLLGFRPTNEAFDFDTDTFAQQNNDTEPNVNQWLEGLCKTFGYACQKVSQASSVKNTSESGKYTHVIYTSSPQGSLLHRFYDDEKAAASSSGYYKILLEHKNNHSGILTLTTNRALLEEMFSMIDAHKDACDLNGRGCPSTNDFLFVPALNGISKNESYFKIKEKGNLYWGPEKLLYIQKNELDLNNLPEGYVSERQVVD
ncbi:MAG: hypothetical protein QE263_02315 [Vampirovibrionales bacterium]|nr:hypothetical protein [Vampirovibrionales bacterium]